MGLLEKRTWYKPFQYDWCFKAYQTQNKMHWIPAEVPMHEDVRDWNGKLTKEEKSLLTQLFRFFVQADLDVASGYIDKYLPVFKTPEVRMMLCAFASTEGIHQEAYALLLDTIGMPETEYQAFQEYEDMKAKHEYLESIVPDSLENIAQTLAIYSAFGEGLQLFSSFVILLNFPRFNKMKGMGQIISWSILDEQHHVDSMIKLFHTFIDENPKLWNNNLKHKIYKACEDMVNLEDKFIDLAFAQGGVEGITQEEVKTYIRYIADRRLLQLHLKTKYKQKTNPLPWLDWMVNGVEHQNFFEGRSVAYAKGSLTGSWGDVWSKLDSK